MGYKSDVIKGFSWLGSFRIVTRILSFVRTAIVARLLSPSQVGVFGIAAIVLSLIELLTETGINIFLTQKKENIDHYISTAWITSMIRGFIISLVIFLAAPYIADFYSVKQYEYVLKLIALVPFIRGFINPSVVKYTKDLNFSKEFYYRTSVFMVETAATIFLLYMNPSPVSLVWGLIAGSIFEVLFSFTFAKPLPAFSFRMPLLREVVGRGKWLTLTGIFNYIYHNGDDIIVGKVLGTAQLGFYEMAYKISTLPITEGSDVVGRVMFPVLVKMTHDLDRLKRAYIKSVCMIAIVVIPMGIAFFFFPEQIIRIILGDQWLSAVPVLRVLALFGVLRAISISVTSPIYALEKQEYVTRITLVSLIGMSITIFPFVQTWGIVGAAYSALVGTLLSIPVALYYVKKVFTNA